VLLVVITISLLNSSLMFPLPYLWIRISIPLLLVFGLIREVYTAKWLSLIGGTLANLGAWLLLITVVRYSVIGDRDAYIEAGKMLPRGPAHAFEVFIQLAIAAMTIVWTHARSMMRRNRTL
jgi:hypothetical protein